MASFRTTEPDREWRLRLTVGLCEDLKRGEGFDIGGLLRDAEKFAEALVTDPGKLVRVLWECCKKEANERGVTPEGFAHLFTGDVLDAAVAALLESAVDFFPKAQGREAIRSGLPKVMAKMEAEADKEMGRRVEKVLSMSFDPAGSTPASSGSTHAT